MFITAGVSRSVMIDDDDDDDFQTDAR